MQSRKSRQSKPSCGPCSPSARASQMSDKPNTRNNSRIEDDKLIIFDASNGREKEESVSMSLSSDEQHHIIPNQVHLNATEKASSNKKSSQVTSMKNNDSLAEISNKNNRKLKRNMTQSSVNQLPLKK